MDIITHILIGASVSNSIMVGQVLPDIPNLFLKISDVALGKASIKEIFMDQYLKLDSPKGSLLVWLTKFSHGVFALLFISLLDFDIFVGYLWHLVLDLVSHNVSMPLFPISKWSISGLFNWSELPLWKHLIVGLVFLPMLFF